MAGGGGFGVFELDALLSFSCILLFVGGGTQADEDFDGAVLGCFWS